MTSTPHGRVRVVSRATLGTAFVGLAVSLGLALQPGAAQSATVSSVIAFSRSDGIYVMQADGSGIRALKRGGVAAGARKLEWSRDGSKLAFVALSEAVWVMNADGTDLTRVVLPAGYLAAGGWSPTWSPDGTRIAFSRFNDYENGEDPDRDIWVVDLDGGNLHRLVQTPRRFEWEVDWRSTGGRIAFATGGWVSQVYAMDLDGRNVSNLTRAWGWPHSAAEPEWSPDGRRIVFTRDPLGEKAEIYVMDARGRAKVALTANTVQDGQPAWSPDATMIAFVRSDGNESRCANCPPTRHGAGEIYVMKADGTDVRRLTHNSLGEASPAWRPAGTR